MYLRPSWATLAVETDVFGASPVWRTFCISIGHSSPAAGGGGGAVDVGPGPGPGGAGGATQEETAAIVTRVAAVAATMRRRMRSRVRTGRPGGQARLPSAAPVHPFGSDPGA